MNRTILIIMGCALLVAILMAVIVQAMLSPSDTKSTDSDVPMVEILVADERIPTGRSIAPDNTRWQEWPEFLMFDDAIVRVDGQELIDVTYMGEKLRRQINKGEPIFKSALVPDSKDGGNFLSASLQPGMRAVSIGVSATTSVGGFVRPGDKVDVILTYKFRLGGSGQEYIRNTVVEHAAETVLTNVRVLAVDQDSAEKDREARVGRTVTLEVDQAGAEIISLARNMGSLTLALRRLGDNDNEKAGETYTTDVSVSDVLQRALDIQKKAIMNEGGSAVRVYSGSRVRNQPVRVTQ